MTDMIKQQYEGHPAEWERAKKIFNLLAERVETATPWLAQQILANQRHGARIAWMTNGKLLGRFLTAGLRRRNVVD